MVLPQDVVTDRSRSVTGLTLLVIGFCLAWIPYLSVIGGLISLIGIIYLILGRRGFGEPHRRYVVAGGLLFLLTILASIALAVGFVVALFGQVSVSSSGTAVFNEGGLRADLDALFVGAAVVGIIGGLSEVVLVYGLSDHTTRILLWAGFVTSIALSLLTFLILYPQVATAVAQATSGSTFNSGPISSLETRSDLLGVAKVLPSLLFAWAYYRVRAEAVRRTNDPRT